MHEQLMPSDSICLFQCKAASCCKDVYLWGLPQEELSKITPQGIRIAELDTLDQLSVVFDERRYFPNGVYFVRIAEDIVSAVLNGRCPNLDSDGRCGIYDIRPQVCRNFEAGGKNCSKARKRR